MDLLSPDALRQHIIFIAPNIIVTNPFLTGVQYNPDLPPTGKGATIVAINHSLLPEDLYKDHNFVCLPTVGPQNLIQQIRESEQPEVELIESDKSKQNPLLQRKCEMVIWVARGLTNKKIAGVLHLSPCIMIIHRRNIAVRLGIHSPSGLTIYALTNNFISVKEVKGI